MHIAEARGLRSCEGCPDCATVSLTVVEQELLWSVFQKFYNPCWRIRYIFIEGSMKQVSCFHRERARRGRVGWQFSWQYYIVFPCAASIVTIYNLLSGINLFCSLQAPVSPLEENCITPSVSPPLICCNEDGRGSVGMSMWAQRLVCR